MTQLATNKNIHSMMVKNESHNIFRVKNKSILCHNNIPVEMYKVLPLIRNAKHRVHRRSLEICMVHYIHAI